MTEKERKKPGPKEERVKVKVPWGEAVKDALRRQKPAAGWPSGEREKKRRPKGPGRKG